METTNAKQVLENVERMIVDLENQKCTWNRSPKYRIYDICDELSIFDWWKDYLSISQLKDMRKFLKTAIKLGYTGYVCFKVGATGCSNGMWAYKNESTTGYSPDGEAIYKSFTPAYNYWSACDESGKWYPDNNKYDSIKTASQLKYVIENVMN